MRNIGYRLQHHHRLSPLGAALRLRLPWMWIVLVAWVAWAAFLSDHSLFRIWKLQRENAHAHGAREGEALRARLIVTDTHERGNRVAHRRGLILERRYRRAIRGVGDEERHAVVARIEGRW